MTKQELQQRLQETITLRNKSAAKSWRKMERNLNKEIIRLREKIEEVE